MHAAILLFPGAEELDVFGPYETLAIAAAAGAPLTVELVSFGPPEPLRLAHGAVVRPAREFAATDLLVVPGGGWNSGAAEGAREQAADPRGLDRLRAAHAMGAVVAGVCTGAMILAAAGLLHGRRAVTHQSAMADLRQAGVTVEEQARVVDAGDVVTCGGITAGLDLALHLVGRFFGADLAGHVAATLEYAPRGEVVRERRTLGDDGR